MNNSARNSSGQKRWKPVFIIGFLVTASGLIIGFDVGGLRQRIFGRLNVPRIQSIAVLPLENLSNDPGYEYFAEGLTAELNYDLSLIGTFRVISSYSTAQYRENPKPIPEIARELNVDGILEGGVQHLGDSVKMTVILRHAPTDRALWEQTYERDLGEIPILLADISRAVTGEIRAELTPQAKARLDAVRPVNAQAFDAYLRAGDPGTEDPLAQLHQAIQLDPAFAMPHAALAGTYYWSNNWPTVPPRDTYPKVKEAAQKALSLDSTNAPAHFYLALAIMEYDWDFAGAEEEFVRNLELRNNCADTHHLYSHFLLSVGRDEEAVEQTRLALELDPSDEVLITCLAWHDITMGQDQEAEKHCSQAAGMGADGPFLQLLSGWTYLQQGRLNDAVTELQKAVVSSQGAVLPTAALGHAYAVAGRRPEAEDVLGKLLERSQSEFVSAYEIATIYAGLEDKDRAFEWLDKAYQERASFLSYFRMDPRLSGLRSDARFQALLQRMNYPRDRLS